MQKQSENEMAKRAGRPAKPGAMQFHAWLAPDAAVLMVSLATQLGVSRTRVIEDAVRDFAKKHKAKPQVLEVPDAAEEAK